MTSLIELRVLEGPNLYFPRAAIKLTVDITGLASAPTSTAERLARRIGLSAAQPGEPDTGFRQRFALRAVARLVRAIARESGTVRLAVRVRPTSDPHVVVVAYPWRHRDRAEEMGRAVAAVLDALPGEVVEDAVSHAAERVVSSPQGDGPHTIVPTIPVVAVTGTNGKTTTSRMIAHIARTAGQVVGWSNTDGIYLDGELVEAGDYSGPSGAGRVLDLPGVEFAVTETARGGILLKGIGLTRNDVSVVTNVSADHLGVQGIDTLDQLAEVKAVVPRITRRRGWAVLNGDDPRVYAMRNVIRARPWVFSRDPNSPAVRETLDVAGRATTVIDGWVSVLRPHRDADPLVELADVPMTLGGLSRFNVENTLAAASAALAVGLSRETVIEGLTSFRPDAEHNPGRMNIFSVPVADGEASVVIDLAHNEAGLEALVEIMAGIRPPGSRLLLGLGAVGDRTDDISAGSVRSARWGPMWSPSPTRRSTSVAARSTSSRACSAPARSGSGSPTSRRTRPRWTASRRWSSKPARETSSGLMCHAQREEAYEWISGHGGSADTPHRLGEKVRAAQV